MSTEENGKHAPRKDRYWSVMLVGDRGRVIPFRHFKGIAISICCLSILLLAACIVMSILYIGQGRKLASLENELKNSQVQISKLRDEKDLYLTKLMLTQKQEKEASRKNKPAASSKHEESKPAAVKTGDGADVTVKAESAAPVKKEQAQAKPPAPKVQWKADIRRLSVSYDAKREVLKAQFRVYNTSKPKKRLSGRGVVVFKKQDDSPAKWMAVPRVQLKGGEPGGSRGQSFRVRNYLTMNFRAYYQKPPILFNMATAYIFGKDGKMLASKDFAFKIETPPPPPKENPAPPPPPPAEKKEQPAPVTEPAPKPAEESVPTVPTVPNVQESGGSPSLETAPGNVRLPAAKPPAAQPAEEPEAKTPSDTVNPPPSNDPATGASDNPTQNETPPATDKPGNAPQPKVEGEPR